MQLHINRHSTIETFSLPFQSTTLLQALYAIKANQDPSLTFDSNCRSGICGACAVRVNGKEVLACGHEVQSDDLIEPLNHHEVVRDLKVNRHPAHQQLTTATAWLHAPREAIITPQEVSLTQQQSDCILCNSCYSSCPVLAVNPNFIGPFALSRAYRYSADPREGNQPEIIAQLQSNGIWDCTLCGECTAVCPQGIDPKMDITLLRSTATQLGYSDPNFQTMDFGFGGF